jgi:hypothetical protein
MNEVGADEMIDYYVWDSVLEFSSKQLPFIFLSKRTITIHRKQYEGKLKRNIFGNEMKDKVEYCHNFI